MGSFSVKCRSAINRKLINVHVIAYLMSMDVRKMKVKIAQSCLTLCDPMDCSPFVSSLHGILQARILGSCCLSPGDLPNLGIELGSPAL